jgi:hypothetical protein
MPIGPARISLLTFPQFWDGNSLLVRFLCLPKGDPQAPLRAGLASFAASNLVYQARVIPSLDRLPVIADSSAVGPLTLDEPPAQKAALFAELTAQFNILPPAPPGGPRPELQFRKVITESYGKLVGERQLSRYMADSNEFECALHEAGTDQPPDPVDPPNSLTWGKVIALALRQPKLASALGLVGQTRVTPPNADFFQAGGWLFIDLHPTGDYAGIPDIAAFYAARIPPLTAVPRSIFAAVLFPVFNAPGNFIADDIYREAEIYDDGLAKRVHCVQSAGRGDSIQLAWDDEQIAEWLNRQVQVNGAGDLKIDAPNGISGYRVDVRRHGDGDWNSLQKIASRGDLMLGPLALGSFTGEAAIEVLPAQISPNRAGLFWFPSYFATWRGSSLALTDQDLSNIHARPDMQVPEAGPRLLNREKSFVPVDDKLVPLQYGETYDFRVRLADLTRGGPDATADQPDPPGSSVTTVTFRRRLLPGPIEILERPQPDLRQVRIAKPRLGYPELLFTGAATVADLEKDLDAISADPNLTREAGVRDPDVLSVEIQVEVKALDGDLQTYLPLYTTGRPFNAQDMTLALNFQDHGTLGSLPAVQPSAGPLNLPTARDVRLVFTAIGRNQPDYFFDESARRGTPVILDVRANATAEPQLLTKPTDYSELRSFFFQPPPADNSVPRPIERLATEIGLDHDGLTLSGPTGNRVVLACAASLKNTLSPERSAVTFVSDVELTQRWINVVQFTLVRDWTWDGLQEEGIEVTRVIHRPGKPDAIEVAGTIRLPHAVGAKTISGISSDPRAIVRQSTELIFFDAFDPKPKSGEFPTEITVDYVLQPSLKALPPPAPVVLSTLLPVTTPPVQTPRIASAGIALSEYSAADDYSSTASRRRVLWFEFEEPVLDPEDAYFVRVLAMAPDPQLTSEEFPDSVEPPIAIDPEWMRLIVPGQPKDQSGLGAMQQNQKAPTAPRHYVIPIPDSLNEASPELFGFFVYEVRVGHTDSRWCTARGRYGPPLRVAGVQHPAPPLICHAARGKTDILVRAPFATPVYEGRNVRGLVPKTELWALLYARIRQADADSWRNVLLARSRLVPPRMGNDPEGAGGRILYGDAFIPLDVVTDGLSRLGLGTDTPLTALTVEIFTDPAEPDPLGERLGHSRILRVSPLTPIPDVC